MLKLKPALKLYSLANTSKSMSVPAENRVVPITPETFNIGLYSPKGFDFNAMPPVIPT